MDSIFSMQEELFSKHGKFPREAMFYSVSPENSYRRVYIIAREFGEGFDLAVFGDFQLNYQIKSLPILYYMYVPLDG